MKTTILFFFVLSFCSFSISCIQSPNCSTFRTGKFKLVDKTNNLDYLIERNDTMQKETNLISGKVSVYKINWETDCKYSLTITEGEPQLMELYKNKKLHIEMIEFYEDGYKFSAKLDGFDIVKYQIIKKIK
jgi:hypothetical protein